MINKIQAIRPKARISARTIKYQRLPAGFRWEEARAASWTAVTTGDGAGGIGLKTGEGCAAGLGHGLSSKGMRVSPAGGTFSLILSRLVCVFFKASLMMLILKQPPPRIAGRSRHRWCMFRR